MLPSTIKQCLFFVVRKRKFLHRYMHTHTHRPLVLWLLPCRLLQSDGELERGYGSRILFSFCDLITQFETIAPRLVSPGRHHLSCFNEQGLSWVLELDSNNHLVNANSWITGSGDLSSKINCLPTWAGYGGWLCFWCEFFHMAPFRNLQTGCPLCYQKMNWKDDLYYNLKVLYALSWKSRTISE